MKEFLLKNIARNNERICVANCIGEKDKQLYIHDYTHISYIKKGYGTYVDNKSEIALSAGDIIIIPEGMPFRFLPSSKSFAWCNILFKKQTVQYRNDSLIWFEPDNAPLIIHNRSAYFQYLFSEMNYEYCTCQKDYQEILYRELLLLLDKIKRAYTDTQNSQKTDHMSKAMLTDTVTALCRRNNTAYVSLKDVASVLHLTPKYFSTLFKKKVGINYKDYSKNLRLERAALLLLTSKANVMDISQFCGYSNSKLFYKAFQEKYGTTPAKFRKSRQLTACNSFQTNLPGWVPDTWHITERGFETMNIKHHAIAISGMCVDGKKSFTFQIKGNFDGSSMGLLFGIKNFSLEAIREKRSSLLIDSDYRAGYMLINSTVYASRILEHAVFSIDTTHTLLLEYNAEAHCISGYIDGNIISQIPVSQEDVAGNLGICASLSEAIIQSAVINWI